MIRGRQGSSLRGVSWLCLALVIGGLAFCVAWRIDGGRWVHVETPSMGEDTPVGSLLWVKPVDFDTLQPGDFITFHPPGSHGLTYSHHVLTRNDDGSLTTQGVIPGPDPWRITADEVVGKVRMNWWGAGWLVVTGPLLIVGFLIVGTLRTLVRGRWKQPVTLVLGSLVLSAAIVVVCRRRLHLWAQGTTLAHAAEP